MFETPVGRQSREATSAPGCSLDADLVRSWTSRLAAGPDGLDDPARIDLIRALEELTCAAQAQQAALSADFDTSQRAEQAARGVRPAQQGRGVAAQIALARRESPHRGQQHLTLATVLRTELPHTRHAFTTGRISEWKVALIVRETACLSLADRRRVDAALAANPTRLESLGDGELAAEAAKLAAQLDPASVVARRRRAESQRRVTLRPAPDVMSQLSALLPVKAGVAVYAVLTREADRLRADGDPRSRGQIMADTLVDRITNPPAGTDTHSTGRPGVMINLVVDETVLFGNATTPAHLEGYGPIPADLAREIALDPGLDHGSRRWLRRLYTSPATGSLTAMDSRARCFPTGLATFLRLRDRTCRTPWCDAPIRHLDHIHAAADGGPTHHTNGQGLCEACNHAKQAPGWTARPRPGPRHTVTTTTPTGHTHDSTAPPQRPPAYVETQPGHWVLTA